MKFREVIKQSFFTVTAVTLGLVAIEVLSFFALPLVSGEAAGRGPAARQNGGAGGQASIFRQIDDDALAPTVKWNIVGNALTYPHEKLMFHVMAGSTEGRLAGYTGVNSLGYRGPEFHLEDKKPAEKRILILGDSCGFGWGVEDFEKTFHFKLERALDGEAENYVLYNLSQPGYSSYQAMTLFNKWADKIKPDFVVLYMGWNDTRKAEFLTDRQAMATLAASNNLAIRWTKESNLYKVMKAIISRARAARAARAAAGASGSEFGSGQKRRSPVHETLENLDTIISKAERMGARPVVILPPFRPWGDYQIYDIHDYNAAIYERFRDRAAFPALNDMRLTNPGNHGMFLRDGYHPAEEGSVELAEELHRVITGKSSGKKPDLRKIWVFNAVQLEKATGHNVRDLSAAEWLKASRHASADDHRPGALVYGPYISLPSGSYKTTFSMRTKGADSAEVAMIKVTADNGRKVLAARSIAGADFPADGQWGKFEIRFSQSGAPLERVETTVEYKGGADVYVDYIKLEMEG